MAGDERAFRLHCHLEIMASLRKQLQHEGHLLDVADIPQLQLGRHLCRRWRIEIGAFEAELEAKARQMP